jgi:hypothetical protein
VPVKGDKVGEVLVVGCLVAVVDEDGGEDGGGPFAGLGVGARVEAEV